MNISTEGMLEIACYEGLCQFPYLDSANVLTIGIGHTHYDGIPPNPSKMKLDDSLSIQECCDIFKQAIQKYVDGVNRAITVDLTQQQFDALVSFHYNTGAIGKATLTKKINAGASDAEIRAQFMQWIRAGGKVNKGLETRRKNEANLFIDGEYSNEGTCLLFTTDKKGHLSYKNSKTIDISKYFY